MFTTLLNSNDVVYMIRAFPSEKVLIKLNSFGSIITSAVAFIFNILFPILMATYSHQPAAGASWPRSLASRCWPSA